MNQHYQVSGHFTFTAIRPDGSRRVLADFDNLILNAGLNRMGTGNVLVVCRLGAGNAAPNVNDTQLASHIVSSNNIVSGTEGAQSSAPYFNWVRRVFRFDPGTVTSNVAEVGVGWGLVSESSLFSRALVKDGSGNPTTISVLPEETLDVTYEIRVYQPTSDSNFNITISSVNHTCVARAANVTNSLLAFTNLAVSPNGHSNSGATPATAYNGTLGTIVEGPSGSSSNSANPTSASYVDNSLQRDFTVTWDVNSGNLSGGVSAVLLYSSLGHSQVSFSPAIDKTNVKTLTLTYRISWSRRP